ncbi:hypothetical protein KKB44_01645 [Candidatus Micrarchaeota archaeon]|nr:hypothetical protein [Candidatus Micrarchaeota archaeon]
MGVIFMPVPKCNERQWGELFRKMVDAVHQKGRGGTVYQGSAARMTKKGLEQIFRVQKSGGPFRDWRVYPPLKETVINTDPVLGDLEIHKDAREYIGELPPNTEYVVSFRTQRNQVTEMHLLVLDPSNRPLAVSSWSKEAGFTFEKIDVSALHTIQ